MSEQRVHMSTYDRRTVLAVLAGVLVVALGCSVWFGAQAYQLRHGASGSNAALADPDATEEVIERVSAQLKSVFSYDYANVDRTERAVGLALTGEAASEYRAQFADAAKRAEQDKLVLVSTVRSIGVRTLTDDAATVLVFLDQQTMRLSGSPKSSTATLDITAVRVDGNWRISAIDPL
ncbi:MAG: hypothetical protein ACRDQ7_07635 [Haloechinothrix sp.]